MINDSIERLRAALKMSGFTKRALAKRASIHPNTLLGCEGEDWNPTLATLRAIDVHLPTWQQIAANALPDWVMQADAPECHGADACASDGEATGETGVHIATDSAPLPPPSTGQSGAMSRDNSHEGIAV
jgi:DNA-binding XRE family transcriptional regulator